MTDPVVWGSLAAIAAAAVGALVTFWLQRSKPWVAITSIHRDDSQLVEVPEDVISAVNGSPWFNVQLHEEVPLRRVIRVERRASWAIGCCKEIIAAIDGVTSEVRSGADRLTVASKLASLVGMGTFRAVVESLNDGGRLSYPSELEVPDTQQAFFKSEEILSDKGHTKAVLLLDGSGKRYAIEAGRTRETIERTKKLGVILQFGLEPGLSDVLATVRETLQGELQSALEVRERVQDLIRTRRLIVRSQVTNTGGAPENIEPFGVLRLRGAGRKIDPMILAVRESRVYEPGMDELPRMIQAIEAMAQKQQVEIAGSSQTERGVPEYVVVKPGNIVQVDLVTLEPVADEQVAAALDGGMLSCELVLRRAGRRLTRWVVSGRQVLGDSLNDSRRAALLKKGAK